MRLTPAARHWSICRLASATSVLPTLAKPPVPPKVMVPIVSAEIRRPDLPSSRYSTRPPYWSAAAAGRRPGILPALRPSARRPGVDLRVKARQTGGHDFEHRHRFEQ